MEDGSKGVPTSTTTDAADVTRYFEALKARHPDTQIRGLTGTCAFDIPPIGRWLLVVNDGYVDIRQSNESADSEVTCSARELLAVVQGRQDAFTAVLQGKIHVSGNLALVQFLGRLAM